MNAEGKKYVTSLNKFFLVYPQKSLLKFLGESLVKYNYLSWRKSGDSCDSPSIVRVISAFLREDII